MKTKVSLKYPVTGCSYVQRWAPHSNYSANAQVPSEKRKWWRRWWKWCRRINTEMVEMVEETQRNSISYPMLPCKSWMFMKENPDRKKNTSRSYSREALGIISSAKINAHKKSLRLASLKIKVKEKGIEREHWLKIGYYFTEMKWLQWWRHQELIRILPVCSSSNIF